MRQHKYDYDAFISHAVEDKIPIANELCAKLERAGLRIWYSGKELGVGDSIEKTIGNGLHRSRYGIVILSPTYLSKNWTIREFYTLLAKEIEEHKVILPVLYNITLDDLKKKDLLMADRFAVNADLGIDHVVDRLVREIRKSKVRKASATWFSRIWVFLTLSLLLNIAFLLKDIVPRRHLSADPTHGPVTTAGLLNGVFDRTSNCDCGHHTVARSNREMPVTVVSEGNLPQIQVIPQRKAGKLTMSIVVEIEDEEAPRQIQLQEVRTGHSTDESDADRPFQLVRSQKTCSHSDE